MNKGKNSNEGSETKEEYVVFWITIKFDLVRPRKASMTKRLFAWNRKRRKINYIKKKGKFLPHCREIYTYIVYLIVRKSKTKKRYKKTQMLGE